MCCTKSRVNMNAKYERAGAQMVLCGKNKEMHAWIHWTQFHKLQKKLQPPFCALTVNRLARDRAESKQPLQLIPLIGVWEPDASYKPRRIKWMTWDFTRVTSVRPLTFTLGCTSNAFKHITKTYKPSVWKVLMVWFSMVLLKGVCHGNSHLCWLKRFWSV